jgi:hypothetical protein
MIAHRELAARVSRRGIARKRNRNHVPIVSFLLALLFLSFEPSSASIRVSGGHDIDEFGRIRVVGGRIKISIGDALPHILLSLISRRDYAASINIGASMGINASADRDKSNALGPP